MSEDAKAAAPPRSLWVTVRFIIVGATNAGVFFVLSTAGVTLGFSPLWVMPLAYAVAVVVGYLLQRNWAFRSRLAHGSAFPRYIGVQAVCAALSPLAAMAAAPLVGHRPALMSAVATVAASVVSYFATSLWVFRDGHDGA